MIISFNGEMPIDKLPKHVDEVVSTIQKRLGGEYPFKLKDVRVGIVFDVDGEEQYLTVEHDGVPEIFEVAVALDKDGEISKSVNNEHRTFMDDYSHNIAKGLYEGISNPIESVYDPNDLEQFNVEDAGDLKAVFYNHKVTGEVVIQYYRNDVLIGEAGYKTKE